MRPLSNLTTRILVALFGIPLIIGLTLWGGYAFLGFVAVVSMLALWEFYGLARARGIAPQVFPGIVMGLCFIAAFSYDRLHRVLLTLLDTWGYQVPFPSMAQVFLIILLVLVPMTMLVELFRGRASALTNIAVTHMGALYVCFSFGALVGLRELFVPADFPVYLHFSSTGPAVPDDIAATIYRWGGWTVLTLFASIWACDSGAYFAGRAFGRHKLFERVSPKKTWEGAVAGFVAAVGAFLLMRALVLPYLSVAEALVCGVIVGSFGQLGDLAESLLKRDAGLKDSSTLIPGHGGILDRFDSIMVVAPVLFLYLDFIVF